MSESEDEVSYTIDELAAATKVPSRTIRFYQGQKILEPPERKGRVAVYTDRHVKRLELIAQLQDRGLQIRGMKQLLSRSDSDTAVSQWLGLSDRLSSPSTEDRPRVVDKSQLASIIGDRPAGTLSALEQARLVERREDAPATVLIPSPGLLEASLRLMDAGLPLDVTTNIEPILREGLRETVEEVVDYFLESKTLDSTGGEEKLNEAIDALRANGLEVMSILFAQEVERALNELLEQGGEPPKRKKRRKRKR